MFVVLLLLAGVVLTAPARLFAQGEHARRAGAELVVLLGDLRLLMQADSSSVRQKGLRDRVAGMLSSLPLLLRLADQERQRGGDQPDTGELQALFLRQDYAELTERLIGISRKHPFFTGHLLIVDPSDKRLRRALATHRQLCAACHDTPYLAGERPAFDLYRQAKDLPVQEFAARMVIGIRGDVVTGLGNPFMDEELAVLIALYRRAADSRDAERF